MKLSIVIPCYNEKNTIREIISRVLSVDIGSWKKEVIIVDDASTDGTSEILAEYEGKLKVIYQDENGGKGTAVAKGLEQASGDYIIIQDADLEYNPQEIPEFLKVIEQTNGLVVYGSRNLHHEKRKGFIVQRMGVWFITVLTNKLYGLKLTDVWTCYKLFPNGAKKYFVNGGFEAELLFTVTLARNGYKISEVAISHSPRDKDHGKKIRYRDGFRAILVIVADRLANIATPKPRMVKIKSEILRCPLCRSRLDQNKFGYTCLTHGLFDIDESLRPILIEKNVFEKNKDEHNSGINWLKSFFKQFPRIYYSIWHVFCPVMMLVNGPRMILDKLGSGSLVADIGSGPERLGPEFINVDVFPFPEVDIVADAIRLPFGDNTLDGAVSESLLEHVPDAPIVAKEMVRVVRRGGFIYVSAPFIHPYHASPDDFNRWTISGLKHMFPDLEIIRAGVRSGPWSAFLIFLAYWLGIILSFGCRSVAPFLAHMFMLILGPLKYFDYFFMKIPGSEAVATHLYILGRKK